MMSVSRIGSPGGAAAYYSKEDHQAPGMVDMTDEKALSEIQSSDGLVKYYSVSEDELGTPLHWEGKGAELLGLDGVADEDAFKAVLYGLNPDAEGEAISKREASLRKEVEARGVEQERVEGEPEAEPDAGASSREQSAWTALSLDERIALAEASQEKHAAGWDLTFSAPKAVSILALDEDGDPRLLAAHRAAVDVAIGYIESHFSVYRVRGENGDRREEISGNLLMARTTHSLSRSGDPTLHDHVIVLNATRDPDGTWRALESEHIYRHMKLAGAIYQAELRSRSQELGHDVRDGDTLNTFTLDAVPPAALLAHSGRRIQIQRNVAEMEQAKGRPLSDPEREQAVLKDRPGKSNDTLAELRTRWSEVNASVGFDVGAAVRPAMEGATGKDRSFDQPSPFLQVVETVKDFVRGEGAVFQRPEVALEYGKDASFHATTVATQHDMLFRAMIANGNRLTLDAYMHSGFFDRPDFLRADRKVLAGVTTQETIDRERAIVSHIDSMRGRGFAFDTTTVAAKLLPDHQPERADALTLTDDQYKAVLIVLTSQDGVVALQGYAGTGKTTAFDTLQNALSALKAIGEVQGQAGRSRPGLIFAAADESRAEQFRALRGAAPTHSAVKELRANNIQAETLSALLGRYGYAKEQSATDLHTMRAEYKDSWLLLDESSMMGNRQIEAVFAMQKDLQINKVILSGDIRQIAALQAGAPFKLGMDHNKDMAKAELTTVLRQSPNPSLKEVVVAFAAGKSAEAMKRLLPFIHEQGQRAPDEALADKAFALWKEGGGQAKIVVDTNKMRGMMNIRVRKDLAESGVLKGDSYVQATYRDAGVAGPDKLTTRLYEKGQTLYFFAQAGRFRAGDTLSVEHLNHKRNVLSGTDGNGRASTLDLGQRSGGKDLPFGVYRKGETSFAVGERVLFNKTDRSRHIKTSDEFEIVGISNDRVLLRPADRKEEALSIPRADPQLAFMTYAYAVTADKAQGKSFQSVIAILKSTGQGEFVNAARAYIMASRAKADFHLVTDSFRGLMRKVTENDGINLIALDQLFDRKPVSAPKPAPDGTSFVHPPDLTGQNANLVNKPETNALQNATSSTDRYIGDGSIDIGDKTKAMDLPQPERSL